MSPTAAIESDVFRAYLAIAAALLLLGGAALAVLGLVLRKNVAHAWASYRGWLVMIPVVILVVFLGRPATIVFFTALAAWAFMEFARATRLDKDRAFTSVVYASIAAAGIVSLINDPFQHVPGWYGLFIVLPVYAICAILAVPIIRNRTQGQLQAIALAIMGFLYFGWMFGHLAFLANSRYAYGYLLYLLFAVEINDVAAYTTGKFFGRHKLRSNVSPNKTWEGSLGALAVSLALPWALQFSFPHFAAIDLILIGLIVGIAGQLGDLSISVIKRDLGIKDMGTVIQGHGGILDRIDSLIYVAPLFFHLVRFRYDLY